jgi:23S rRNA A2030 N6-methylase RlmJ
LFQLISDGLIKAKLNAKEQMISFLDTTAGTSSTVSTSEADAKEAEYLEIVEELEKQNQRIVQLM